MKKIYIYFRKIHFIWVDSKRYGIVVWKIQFLHWMNIKILGDAIFYIQISRQQ